MWTWTAGVCAGSASPTNQPGQQSRSAQRVSVLLWGAGGLCQKGLEKKCLCICPDFVHISLIVFHANMLPTRYCRSFQRVCSPRWPKSSNCRSMTLWRCPHVWTKTNWRTTLNSVPVMRYDRYIWILECGGNEPQLGAIELPSVVFAIKPDVLLIIQEANYKHAFN